MGRMSYTITVTTTGGVSSFTTSGDVPDGEHEISGHDQAAQVDVTVRRRGPDGRFLVSASHSHSRESS